MSKLLTGIVFLVLNLPELPISSINSFGCSVWIMVNPHNDDCRVWVSANVVSSVDTRYIVDSLVDFDDSLAAWPSYKTS